MSFVNLKLDLYSALVSAVVCDVSCYTGPRYNGTTLYHDNELNPCHDNELHIYFMHMN